MNGWQRRFAYIERPPEGRDAQWNTPTGDWVSIAYEPGSPALPVRYPVWARDITPARDERVALGVSMGSRRTMVRMRWRNDITSAMRLTLLGDPNRVMQIIGGPVEIEGRKRKLEMMCEEVTS